MEHWLPFFYERLETVFDYLPDTPVIFDHLAHEALAERHTLILDHYEARKKQADAALKDAVPYKPVAPDLLYLSPENLIASLGPREAIDFTPFDAPDAGAKKVFHAGSRHGRSFVEERADPNVNVFDVVVRHIADERAARRRVVVAGWTEGSLDRLGQILAEHHLGNLKQVETLAEAEQLEPGQAALAVLPLESGFETEKLVVVAEQDILGDRLIRRSKRKKRASDFIAEASALSAGDIVVHADHGIGRFIGLRTIEAVGAPHDCLEIHYAGDDRLFLPVENIELLSRYGSDTAEATLDKLGGGAWQSRKAKLKKRLLDMAGQLIRIAAERQMRAAPALVPAEGLYDEFSARFPYEETDDQQTAIDSVRRRPRRRQADGPADLRRCRLRQDGSGAARRLHRGHGRVPGRRGGADDAVVAPAFQDVFAALFRPADPRRPGLAAGRRQGTGRDQERHRRRARSTSSSAPMRCSAPRSRSRISAC